MRPSSQGRWTSISLQFIVLGLVMASGCSLGSAADTTVNAPTAGFDGPGITTSEESGSDPIQAEILADGAVSHAEMERALFAVVTCVQSEGYNAELLDFRQGRGWDLQSWGATEEEADLADEALGRCYSTVLSDVEVVYLEEYGPTEQEVQAGEERMRACLADRGYETEGVPMSELMIRVDPDEFVACDELSG